MLPRIHFGLSSVGLLALMLPACTVCPVFTGPSGPHEQTDTAAATMPEVPVSRVTVTTRPMGMPAGMPVAMRLWETLTAKPPARRLEPPAPLEVEITPAR